MESLNHPANDSPVTQNDFTNDTNEEKHQETRDATIDVKAEQNEDVAGDIFGGGNGKNYRTMGRWDTIFALVTNQLGLGILSLPMCLRILGIVPGLIVIIGIGLLTWYCGVVLHQFYCRHPQVVNMVDMCRIMGGRPGEIIGGVVLVLQLVLACASTAVTLSVVLNTVSGHAVCTVGFVGISSLIIWLLCLPRTVKFISKSGLPCLLSILIASCVVIVSLGVVKPAQAPEGWSPKIEVATSPSFAQVFNVCLRVFFAYAGNIAYPSYMAEMRDPVKDFRYGLTWLFGVSITLYSAVAIAIYCTAGEFTSSPALSAAPSIYAKVAYGIIIPAVITTGLSNGHVGIKYIYVEIMKYMNITHEITSNSILSWSIWTVVATIFWILCFIISNAIPIFDSILSITSCTTYAWSAWGISALFWLHMNKGEYFSNWKQISLLCFHIGLIVLTLFLNSAGLWSSISELLDSFESETGVRGAFDCGDNSAF